MKRIYFPCAIVLIISAALISQSCKSGKNDSKNSSYTKTISTNIENLDSLSKVIPSTWKNLNTVVEGVASSGKYASKIDSVHIFSMLYESKLSNIDNNIPVGATFSAKGCALIPDSKAIMVISVNHDKYYSGVSVDSIFNNVGEWKDIKASFKFPKTLKSDDEIKAYVWNQGKGEFLIDNYKLELIY